MSEQTITESIDRMDEYVEKSMVVEKTEVEKSYKIELVWRNVILMILLHVGAVIGFVLGITKAKILTIIFSGIVGSGSALGILVGAHRLWTHRSFKAEFPLQLILAFLQTLALQNDIYEWSRDHRVHHKYSETDADPHNATRGFFFSHVGWLLCRKHPEVVEKGKSVYMDDLENDPLVQFQRTFYIPLIALIWGVIPTAIPYFFWGESLINSFFLCVIFRYVIVLNYAWLVNSAAHLWGMKPYDKQINPVECYVRHLMAGEGFHNFHHTFAWDYSASEYGPQKVFNPATVFIDFFAYIGWAYDLKKVPEKTVRRQMMKHGDINFKFGSPFFEWFFGGLSVGSPWLAIVIFKLLFQYEMIIY